MTSEALTVADLLRQRAGEVPEATALVVDGASSLTYRQWERRSNAVGRGLVARGVAVGDRVVLLFANADWLDYAVGYLAVVKAGAVAVPLGPRFAGEELAHIVAHCGARAILAAPRHDIDKGIDTPRYDVADLEATQSNDTFQVGVASSDLAEILYTSGTTGLPKGVACSHASILFHDAPPEHNEIPGPASFVHAFPIGTNAGQEVLRVPLRRSDRTAVALPVFDPHRYCAVIADRRVRRLQLVPAMAQLIMNSGAYEVHDVTSVERVVLSSAPSPPALLSGMAKAFPRAALWNTYALTEAGTARTLNTDALAHPTSVGRPVGGTELRVVGPADEELSPGATGEVLLRRPGAPARSYYRDAEATAATFTPEGWVRTGDLGYVDQADYLYLVDRKKDLIIVGGLNVSSVEVEGILYDHPSVAEAAVFGVEHPVLGQDVAAAVVLRSPVERAELQAYVRTRLGEHKVPHYLVFVDELPHTATGKVPKFELRRRLPDLVEQTTFVAPGTPTEKSVIEIWEEALDRRPIGAHDDFFELGGHSLAAARIAARVEDRFSVALPVGAIFDAPTPAALAVAIEDAQASIPPAPDGER